jgi:hypothetical protein
MFQEGRRIWVATCAVAMGWLIVGGASAVAEPSFGPAVKLHGAAAGTEPRVTVDPSDHRWIVTNDETSGDAIVFGSHDGGATWTRTAAEPANQTSPTIDTDIVSTRTGRLIASELDAAGINFRLSYSDDGGKSWTASSGAELADTDRQWLAVGPDDPVTHKPRVYLLFHNLASGTVTHNMFVQTSTDGGASFAPPVPITQPPSQAWQDLQCSDSGGPSNIFVNQKTGRVYAVWGTRTAMAAGGCGASVFGPFEVNVVAATRVWVASSPDGSLGSWTPSLAVDDSATNRIVGMQLSPGAVDDAGNVYVTYPESQRAYPDYSGAAIKYVYAPADLSRWSAPVTVAPAGGPGHVLTHIVAGYPGQLDFAFFTGVARAGAEPAWYVDAAQTLNGLAAKPSVSRVRLSGIPTYTGTASELMGACASGPAAGAENGLACSRATDVWGIALDNECRATITWPTVKNDATGSDPGTFVATQTKGTNVCTKRR